MTFTTSRFLGPARSNRVSSDLAIGTATAFVLASAVLSLLVDRPISHAKIAGAALSLRGTIAPSDGASDGTPPRVEIRKRAALASL